MLGFVVGFGFDVGFGLSLGGFGDVLFLGFGVGSGFFGGELGGFSVFGTVEAVHGANNYEDDKGNEEEVDDVLDEVAVGDVGDRIGAEDVGDVEGEAGKVETAGEKARDWHDNVVDEGFDDGGEGATNCNTDGEIDDAAAVDKLFELLDEAAFFGLLGGVSASR